VGYLAYLLTGRFYFMEEVQFAAIANHLNVTDWIRGGGERGAPAQGFTGASGITTGQQVRGNAWWLRSLAQALAVTHDEDTGLQGEFKSAVESTVNWYHARYVAQSNNPFGFVRPDVDYGGFNFWRGSPWQQDFFTGAVGFALAFARVVRSTRRRFGAEGRAARQFAFVHM
jgi:hypothetical protein